LPGSWIKFWLSIWDIFGNKIIFEPEKLKFIARFISNVKKIGLQLWPPGNLNETRGADLHARVLCGIGKKFRWWGEFTTSCAMLAVPMLPIDPVASQDS
jgi:hypothetical protein